MHILREYPVRLSPKSPGLSIHTLTSDTPDNIIAMCRFDSWLGRFIPSPISLSTTSALTALIGEALETRKKRKSDGTRPDITPSSSQSKCQKLS